MLIPVPPVDPRTLKLNKELSKWLSESAMDPAVVVREGAVGPVTLPLPGCGGHMGSWMTGHRLSLGGSSIDEVGPCDDIDMIIIGPAPEEVDTQFNRHLNGDMQIVREEFVNHGFDLSRLYYTTVGRCAKPQFEKKYKAAWTSAGIPFVRAELAAFMAQEQRPKVILAMGAAAVEALYGDEAKMSTMRGNVQMWNGIPVVVTVSPAQFMAGYAGVQEWRQDICDAANIAWHGRTPERESMSLRDYRVARTADEFDQTVDHILAADPKWLAFDCEWGNDCARDEFGYTISVQVSWGRGKAAYFMLRQPGVAPEYWVKQKVKAAPIVAAVPTVAEEEEDEQEETPEQPSPAVEEDDAFWVPEPVVAKKGRKRTDWLIPPPGFNIIHTPEQYERCKQALKRLLADSPARLIGHNVRVDVKQLLVFEGISLVHKLATAFDTMLVHHILHQDDDQGLEVLVRKYCPELGAYWEGLNRWLDGHFVEGKKPSKVRKWHLRFGYRDIPEDVMVPYGLCDADATYRCFEGLEKEWASEAYAKRRGLYWRQVMPSNEQILEIETGGIRLDVERLGVLNQKFLAKFQELEKKVRELLHWPGFNVSSPDHVCEALFRSTRYKDKKVEAKDVVPAGATCLSLTPVCNTDKYPLAWADIADEGLERRHRPSTKAESLKIILKSLKEEKRSEEEKQIVQIIHDLKILSQFLKNFLKPPTVNEFVYDTATKTTRLHVEGVALKATELRVHEEGASFLERRSQITGLVSGTLLQTTDTGRCRMFRANLQVFPKKQESEIKRIFKGETIWKVKSCVIAQPPDEDGEEWVQTEADFKQAESWIMAYLGNDTEMLKILACGRDMHCENCDSAFHPEMPEHWGWNGSAEDIEKGQAVTGPTDAFEHIRHVLPPRLTLLPDGKKRQSINGVEKTPEEMRGQLTDYDVWAAVVKSLYPGKRTAAKTISFGIPYGRAARALTREIRKADVQIEVDETQKVIDNFYEKFQGVKVMLQEARRSAVEDEHVENVFGRRRYFTGVSYMPKSKKSAAEREAGNFPIQSCVADLLYQALINVGLCRKGLGADCPEFKICLIIHDAMLITHRRKDTHRVHELIRFCMGEANTIPGTNYYLGADIETFQRWGEASIHKSG